MTSSEADPSNTDYKPFARASDRKHAGGQQTRPPYKALLIMYQKCLYQDNRKTDKNYKQKATR
jgi:hypothetical protein